MTPPEKAPAISRWVIVAALAVIAAALAIAAITTGYDRYTERYTVTTEGRDGLAVARVVQSTLSKASDLKVSTLTGTVQSVASDSRGFGMINSNRVMKAPFEVDYFVNLSALGPGDFMWDDASDTLTVRAPAVRLGKVNVDESRTYLDRTTGIFVTRDAMAKMQRQASAGAVRVAREEAGKPDKMAAARRNAQAALMALFGAPLRAQGIDAKVVVRFADERARDGERWDVSKSLQEVLAEAR